MCCNGCDIASHRKRQYGIERTAVFEGAAMLKIFALEYDSPVGSLVQSGRAYNRRSHQPGSDAVGSGGNVCESGYGSDRSFHG
jgi:hypothetical protein